MPSPTPRRPDDLVQLLTRAERLAVRRLQGVLETEGCSLDAWRVLAALSDGEGHHMTGLAEAAFLPPPTLTKLVDQLVDQNLVHRRVDPFDRRRVLAHLTLRGREFWQRVDRAVRAVRPPLGDGDDELLRSLLDRLAAALEDPARVGATGGERRAVTGGDTDRSAPDWSTPLTGTDQRG